MNIIVCIKQVPDISANVKVKIDDKTGTLVREGVPSIINPFDENAVEEAIRIKEKHGGKVTVITMGPPQAESALRQTIALGVDEAILVSDRAFAGADTLATSHTLSSAIKKIGNFDLILFGKQAIDGDTAQVGPGVAEHLSLPQITYARKIDFEDTKVVVQRMLEETVEIVEVEPPCVISVVRQINEPRYASLKGMMKSKSAVITKWTLADLDIEETKVGLKGSPTQVMRTFTPPPKGNNEMLDGSSEEVAQKLVEKLRGLKII